MTDRLRIIKNIDFSLISEPADKSLPLSNDVLYLYLKSSSQRRHLKPEDAAKEAMRLLAITKEIEYRFDPTRTPNN